MKSSAQGSRIRLLSVSTCLVLVAALLAVTAPAATAAGSPTAAAPMSAADAAAADKALPKHKAGSLIVGYSPTATDVQKGAARAKSGAKSAKRLSPKGPHAVELVTLAAGESVSAAIAKFKSSPGVRYAEPDYLLTKQVTSDDPYYTGGSLWGMYGDGTSPTNPFGSAAGEAWAAGYTGSRSVAIGVIDEGIQFAHPDLAANIWTNPLEIAGNGVDDDANGFIDDIHGWDFINNNATVYDGNSTEGSDTHGTHVSGTIGGLGGNGSGVAGVNWAVTIVSAKFLGPSGGSTSDAVRALDYLRALKVSQGLRIVATSNSWGGGGFSTALNDAINRAGDQGMLFVAAAGNSSSNNDVVSSYPSNNECTNGGTRGYDCVIAVGSITSSGALSSFSSYGATTVDIAAPGSGINSTYPVDSYASLSGTSMATPHVSGAIALCASINPSLTAAQLRSALVNSARSTPSLAGFVVNGGRLDIGAMVTACLPPTSPVVGDPTALAATAASPTTIGLTWADTVASETAYEIERAPFASSVCGTFTRMATTGAGATAFTVASLSPSTDYCFRVRASNNYLGGSSTVSSSVTVRTLDPPAPYRCIATTYAWVDQTAGTPTTLTLTDDSSTTVSLPFSVSLYDGAYNSAQVSSNGFLRLGTGAATAYSNAGIPSMGDPNNFVAPWWDDLNPGAGGTIWTMVKGAAPNRQFVVTWDNVAVYGVAGSGITMQALIDEGTGVITFQYLDTIAGSAAKDNGASATIGVENADGTAGTQVGLNQAVVSSGTSLRCTNSVATGPAISTASLPVGTTGVTYSQTVTANGGTSPYTWSLASGTVPAGLSLEPSTGVISGSPTTAGQSDFTVKVTDSASGDSTRALSIVIGTPVSVGTSTLVEGSTGSAYGQTLSASGGTGSYTWATTAGALPTGLSLAAGTGVVSGTPSVAGTFNFTVRATDDATRTDSRALSIVISAPVAVSTSTLPAGTTGQAYSQTLAATGGTGPYAWSISSGSLPVGVSLGADGSITGTPSATGTASFTVSAQDSASATATRALSIVVAARVSVTTTTLASGNTGTAYSRTVAATGGTGSYTWAVTAGALPTGLSLGSVNGTISGTPTAAGTFTFTVRATDGASRTGSGSLSITVAATLPGIFNKSTPANGTTGLSRTSATLTWAASTGATSYEYCYDSSRNSVCNGAWVSVGANRTATIGGLGSRLNYEWQVRAVNTAGLRLANAGIWWRFTSAR